MASPPHFPKLTIKNDSMAAYRAKIFLDDLEITQWCTHVVLDLQLKQANQVSLTMLVGEVDVQTEQTMLDLTLTQKTPLNDDDGLTQSSA